jgi:hypothetical protein
VFVKAVFAPSHSVFSVKLRPAELRGLGGARGLELSWRRFTDRWTTHAAHPSEETKKGIWPPHVS